MMQLKDRNEDTGRIMHIALTAVITVLTGRLSCCLWFINQIHSSKKKGTQGSYIFNVACSKYIKYR